MVQSCTTRLCTLHAIDVALLTSIPWALANFPPTQQYFLWYTILLPFYVPYSSLLSSPRLGITAAVLWVGTQVRLPYPFSSIQSPLHLLFPS
jgi:hypothetical protein